MSIKSILKNLFVLFVSILTLTNSSLPPADPMEHIRAFTRNTEFDFVTWTIDALLVKNSQAALCPQRYMSDSMQRKILGDYLALVDNMGALQSEIADIYADPNTHNPAQVAAPFIEKLDQLESQGAQLGAFSESMLQQQISSVLADLNLTVGGQPFPPLLYHVTALPKALIVSPRSVIRQDADISLRPDLDLEEITELEKVVEKKLDVSALVVDIGGIGIYPTMVLRTSNFPWMIEAIAHEWTHNFLTLRPLGMSYYNSGALRTMNETTANIAGKEIALAVFDRYYPELVPPPPETQSPAPATATQPPAFDFRGEMHETRITVDAYLAEGKVDEAESYMEQRRQMFWNSGYPIRRLNQAYFAFHGAYADIPGGEAGEDPVGPAVVALRQKSSSLADFLNRISWMTTFDDLRRAIQD